MNDWRLDFEASVARLNARYAGKSIREMVEAPVPEECRLPGRSYPEPLVGELRPFVETSKSASSGSPDGKGRQSGSQTEVASDMLAKTGR